MRCLTARLPRLRPKRIGQSALTAATALCMVATTGVAVRAQVRVCGQLTDTQPLSLSAADTRLRDRMVGGSKVLPGELPAQVALARTGAGMAETRFFCGATLLSERFALTAAHCLGVVDDSDWPVVRDPRSFFVYVPRSRDLSAMPTSASGEAIAVARFTCARTYANRRPDDADLAIIELARDAPEWAFRNGQGQPHIVLPGSREQDRAFVAEGEKATVTGWGATESGNVSNVLMQAQLARVSGNHPHCVSGEHAICLGGGATGTDSCNGDSGGFAGAVRDGRMFQIGIVQFGPTNCGGSVNPGRYTRIANYLDFIREFLPDAGR